MSRLPDVDGQHGKSDLQLDPVRLDETLSQAWQFTRLVNPRSTVRAAVDVTVNSYPVTRHLDACRREIEVSAWADARMMTSEAFFSQHPEITPEATTREELPELFFSALPNKDTSSRIAIVNTLLNWGADAAMVRDESVNALHVFAWRLQDPLREASAGAVIGVNRWPGSALAGSVPVLWKRRSV